MRGKLNFTSLFFKPNNNNNNGSVGDITTPSSSSSLSSSSSSWPWPSCTNPRTNSFRNDHNSNEVFKTVNSIYFDSTDASFLSAHNSSSSELNYPSETEEEDPSESSLIIKEVFRSDRLFFDPACCKSICDDNYDDDDDKNNEKKKKNVEALVVPFKESVAMAMESEDPYGDFRRSMEEMVMVHGIREWECLEEMLVWFLRVNGKKNHGFIVGAFVDLLVGIGSSEQSVCEESSEGVGTSSNCSNSIMSASSSSVSVCFEIEEVKEEESGCSSC